MGGAFGFVSPVIPENSSRGVRREKCYPSVSRFVRVFNKNFTRNCREFFPTNAYKKEVRYKSDFLLLFRLSVFNFLCYVPFIKCSHRYIRQK